jgi:hypothetical protein
MMRGTGLLREGGPGQGDRHLARLGNRAVVVLFPEDCQLIIERGALR